MCSQRCEPHIYIHCLASSCIRVMYTLLSPFSSSFPVCLTLFLYSQSSHIILFQVYVIKWPRAGFCFISVFSSESLYLLTDKFNSFTFMVMTDVFGTTPAILICIPSYCFLCVFSLCFSGLSYIFTIKIRI